MRCLCSSARLRFPSRNLEAAAARSVSSASRDLEADSRTPLLLSRLWFCTTLKAALFSERSLARAASSSLRAHN